MMAIAIITKVWDGVSAGKPPPGWLGELQALTSGRDSTERGLVASRFSDEHMSKEGSES
jgi:hypothetical protein